MERNEAMEVLGLGTAATEQEIEHRYMILVKRYKSSNDPTALAKVAEAYNFLTGRTYEPEPPNPRDAKVVLGRTVKQWKHLWEYGRMKYLAIAAIVVAVGSIAYSIITNVPADFKVFVLGEIVLDESPRLQDFVKVALPDVKNLEPNSAYVTRAGTGTDDAASTQKAFVLIAVGDEDIVVLDEVETDRFAPQGAFLELDDFYAKLQADLPASVMDKVVPVKYTLTTDNGGDGQPHVYGLDVTGLGTDQALGIYGTKCIMAISVRTKHLEASQTFIRTFLADTDSLKLLVTPIPTASPTPATTAAPTSAG